MEFAVENERLQRNVNSDMKANRGLQIFQGLVLREVDST